MNGNLLIAMKAHLKAWFNFAEKEVYSQVSTHVEWLSGILELCRFMNLPKKITYYINDTHGHSTIV
ncbi:hypothetical protein [Coxiella-like endosymbiont]|uniref:hypothetical protein n=1 Tax=Coxiella-like endosymbiont TaxID=1592897 RepID=UPI00272B0B4B|nr:hypothetical protein [Coxiella-like endosymbiont]